MHLKNKSLQRLSNWSSKRSLIPSKYHHHTLFRDWKCESIDNSLSTIQLRFSTAHLPDQSSSHHLRTPVCGRESLLMAHHLKWLFSHNKKMGRGELPIAIRPTTTHWVLSKPSQAPSAVDDVTSSDTCQINKQAPTCLPPNLQSNFHPSTGTCTGL